jgi:glycosyltransferase involved in cell wall biosynthesis/predicted Zn-dependent protease
MQDAEMPLRLRFEHRLYPHWGGRSGYTQLVRHLNTQNFDTVLHGVPDSDDVDNLLAWLRPLKTSLRTWTWRHGRMPWYRLGDLSAEVAAFEDCCAGRLDIVHFLDGEQSGQFLPRAVKVAGLSNIRTIASFHQPPELASKIVNGELLRWFDAIVLVSPSQISFFKQFVSDDKLHVLLHGVDAEFFRPSSAPNQSKQIRCITTGHWLRDWNIFKDVAKALHDVAFDVVTKGEIKLDDLPNVTTYAGISDADIADLYRSADILFLPLIQSTANNTLLEGIASGLPVVSSDLDAVRAYLPNGEGLLVPENRVDKFVDAIRMLQQDVALRHDMGRRARARAEELAWPRLIRRYESFYEDLLSCPPKFDQPNSIAVSTQIGSAADIAEQANKYPRSSASEEGAADADYVASNGNSLLKAGLFSEAESLFQAQVSIFPDDHHWYAWLARTAECQWNWKAAVETWNKCLSLAPQESRIEAIAAKSHCLIQLGKVNEARELFESIADRFEGLSGLARIAQLEGAMETAGARWEECTIQFPDQISGFLEKATFYLDSGWFRAADALLNHVLSVWPDSKEACVLCTEAAVAEGDWGSAKVRWRTLLANHITDPTVCGRYGRHVATCNNSSEISAFVTGLADHPVARAAFLLEFHLARHEYDAAIEQAQRFVRWHPQKSLHRLQTAVLMMLQGSKEALRQALSLLHDLLGGSPESVLIKVQLIEAYIRSGLESEAKNLLKTIPTDDIRVEVEIFRAWARHHDKNDADAMLSWKILFFDFKLIQITKNFFAGDLSLNFHPAAICASAVDLPFGVE